MSSNSPSSAARSRDNASIPQEFVGTGIEKDEVIEDAVDEEKLVCKLEKLGRFIEEVDRNKVSALVIRCKKLIDLLVLLLSTLLLGEEEDVGIPPPCSVLVEVDDVVEVEGFGASDCRNESKRNMFLFVYLWINMSKKKRRATEKAKKKKKEREKFVSHQREATFCSTMHWYANKEFQKEKKSADWL